MISYNANYNKNKADKKTFDYNETLLDYSDLNSLLSNKFDNDYFYQKAGVGYRFKTSELNITASVDYQKSELKGVQEYPLAASLNYYFYNFLPAVRINYKIDKSTQMFFNYRTSTNAPSISQLQSVINNSDPYNLSVGNPDLKQQLTHNLSGRFNWFSSDFNNVFFTFISFNFRNNYIANSTYKNTSLKDSVIQASLILPVGGQLTTPVNLDGYWNTFGMMNYGFPINFITSKMNITFGGSFTKTPSMVNKNLNYSDAYNVNGMILLSRNFSTDIDFNISSRVNYNKTNNTLRSDLNLNYNNFQNNLNLKWIIWEGLFFQTELSNQFYTGIAPTNSNFTLLNLSIGKKILKGDNGEIKLTVFDALNQNKSNSTNITDTYTEQVYNNVLTRYVLLTFTYNLKNFGGNPMMPGFGFPGGRH